MTSWTGTSDPRRRFALSGSLLLALLIAPSVAREAAAAASDGQVLRYGYPGCDHTVTTNHFVLEPGETFQFTLDFSACTDTYLGGMLYYGYETKRTWSRPLEIKDGVELKILDPRSGSEISYEDYNGYNGAGKLEHVFIELPGNGIQAFSAQNTRRQPIKIRLRVKSGL